MLPGRKVSVKKNRNKYTEIQFWLGGGILLIFSYVRYISLLVSSLYSLLNSRHPLKKKKRNVTKKELEESNDT